MLPDPSSVCRFCQNGGHFVSASLRFQRSTHGPTKSMKSIAFAFHMHFIFVSPEVDLMKLRWVFV